MDIILCDELLQEIFQRLTPASASAVRLVCRRWLHLYRTSTTSLSLRFAPDNSLIPSMSSLLSHYPFLSSLHVTTTTTTTTTATTTSTNLSDHLLVLVSTTCPKLVHLQFLAGPVSLSPIISLSRSCTHLVSLTLTLSRPCFLMWVILFPALKELSLTLSGTNYGEFNMGLENSDAELPLESLSLSGICYDDREFGWLWRSCRKLRKLKLWACQSLGDGGSFSSFVKCLQGLHEVDIGFSRPIVHGVLLKLAENCCSLNSLSIHHGGSIEGLLYFIDQCRCNLKRLNFRLPLDLNNDHLLALARKFQGLSSLRLQNCGLGNGLGLKSIGKALSNELEEFALINCDVVTKEPGLLTTLGQDLRLLSKLDLSDNEMLLDKEFTSMLLSCEGLIELKLARCGRLTGEAIFALVENCRQLECVDIIDCRRIQAEVVEFFVLNSPKLRQLRVEESKLSDVARSWALRKSVEVGFD